MKFFHFQFRFATEMYRCSSCKEFTDKFSNTQLKKKGKRKCEECLSSSWTSFFEEKQYKYFAGKISEIADSFLRFKLKDYTGIAFPSTFTPENKRKPQMLPLFLYEKIRPIIASVYEFYASARDLEEFKKDQFLFSFRTTLLQISGYHFASSRTFVAGDMEDENYKKVYLETRERLSGDNFMDDFKKAADFHFEEKRVGLPKITDYKLTEKLSEKELERFSLKDWVLKSTEPPAVWVSYKVNGKEIVTVWASPDEDMVLDDVILISDRNKYKRFVN